MQNNSSSMFNSESSGEKEKVFRGAITIFYKSENENLKYLVVENTKTGNISFVSGAQEEADQSLEDAAQREIKEELGLEPDGYQLIETDVKHEFVFGPKKLKRAGHKGAYQVFIADASALEEIGHTEELSSMKWMTEEKVLMSLTFQDLKEVFEKAVKEIKSIK